MCVADSVLNLKLIVSLRRSLLNFCFRLEEAIDILEESITKSLGHLVAFVAFTESNCRKESIPNFNEQKKYCSISLNIAVSVKLLRNLQTAQN